jgi:[protein-PII] uridylyltransferase
VLAVGGYGGSFFRTDIDVFLLTSEIAGAKEAISAFLQHLWDAGLRMSHSVRTPDECTEARPVPN